MFEHYSPDLEEQLYPGDEHHMNVLHNQHRLYRLLQVLLNHNNLDHPMFLLQLKLILKKVDRIDFI